MIKDALRPLREPVAWVLLGAIALYFIGGLWDLLDNPDLLGGSGSWFLYNAYYDSGDFANITVAVALTVAVLAVTVMPDRTKLAKPIVLIAMIEAGIYVLFGIMTLILGLFYQGDRYTHVSAGDKGQHIVYGLPLLALTVVPLLVGLAVFRSAELSPPRQQPVAPQGGYYQQQVPPQQPPYPGAPYGGWQGGTPQPQPQQQPHPQQPPHTYGQGWS